MSLTGEPVGHPRMSGQQAEVVPGSPLAVVALFTEIIRERFRPANQLAWVWSDNATPATTETNETDAPRKIAIETAYNTHTEVRNFRPAIFVDKGVTVAEKMVLDNKAGHHLPSGLEGFFALGTIPIEIEVISSQKGESAILADTVWIYLLAGRHQIRATFGLHELTNPSLGPTAPFEADKTCWSTKIFFQVQVELRWTTRPISPILREILVRYRDSGETNPSVFLLKQYIR